MAKDVLKRIGNVINYRAPRGEFNLGYGHGLQVQDVPSRRWTRGTDTVVSAVRDGEAVEIDRVPTGGIVNRLVNGRARVGTFSGPVYRLQAEMDLDKAVRRAESTVVSTPSYTRRRDVVDALVGMALLSRLAEHSSDQQPPVRRSPEPPSYFV